MKVYPYREEGGHHSVLEASDLDDAKQWLESNNARIELCEVEMTRKEFRAITFSDKEALVDYFLVKAEKTYKVGK